jgi:diguanylate cyclase (GGDEF)-like protein
MARIGLGDSPSIGVHVSIGAHVRAWQIWQTPQSLRRLIFGVQALVVGLSAFLLVNTSLTSGAVIRLVFLLGLSVVAEEVLARVERLRFRLSSARRNDLTSVFTFAGALTLPPILTVVLVIAVRAHVWYRYAKQSGQLLYRQGFTCSTVILASLSARVVINVFGHADKLVGGASAIVGTLCAIVLFTVVNHGLLYVAISLAVRPDKPAGFFAQWQDNLLEVATLCLGGLTALAVLYQPWFAILVLPTMVVLQRTTLTKELEIAATTDSKTGLLNAVTWQQLAQRELARAQREKQSAALLIIDMDNFKLINDTHGHLVGDAVLKAVAACLTDELRGYDAVGRFGGEEFVAILADSDAFAAINVADRILSRVRALTVANRDDGVVRSMSASIGVACYPQDGVEIEDLLHAADAALYRAKNAGRDRAMFHVKAL